LSWSTLGPSVRANPSCPSFIYRKWVAPWRRFDGQMRCDLALCSVSDGCAGLRIVTARFVCIGVAGVRLLMNFCTPKWLCFVNFDRSPDCFLPIADFRRFPPLPVPPISARAGSGMLTFTSTTVGTGTCCPARFACNRSSHAAFSARIGKSPPRAARVFNVNYFCRLSPGL
jgi:hypothetical protein